MPRITPCRILKLFLLPWIVLFGVWFFLPSLPVSVSERNSYIANALSTGRTLITVHKWDHAFEVSNNRGQMEEGESGDTTHIGIRWQLQPNKKSHVETDLQVGDTLLHLSQMSADANAFFAKNDPEGTNSIPYFTKSLHSRVRAGGTNHPYNMPWFTSSDRVLLFHEFIGSSADIDFCIIIPKPGVLQLWKRLVVNEVLERIRKQHDFTGQSRSDIDPMDSLEFPNANKVWSETYDSLVLEHRNDGGMIAEFKDGKSQDEKSGFSGVSLVQAEMPVGDLPSRTFPIRRALVFPLGPTPYIISYALYSIYLFGAFVLWPYGVSALAIYVLSVIGMWIRAGRPDFMDWSSRYGLTSFWFSCCACCIRLRERRRARKMKKVWGPAGPLLESEKMMRRGGELDVEKGGRLGKKETSVGLQRPVNAKLGYKKEWRNAKF
ncbi:hypothetical protein P280DRAFT_76109 [Massarina eburnea CBS 473.64]|uniref:Uncharacterized protein n=1 Tax=Massarina eburnea CBS 473.64 TaxID=1395130 RepID=A0A6A6RTD9_9PLEO|nr:hypothetical protein P280DRAFT_76109 [Massarina eburnea CBS 473.64]